MFTENVFLKPALETEGLRNFVKRTVLVLLLSLSLSLTMLIVPSCDNDDGAYDTSTTNHG